MHKNVCMFTHRQTDTTSIHPHTHLHTYVHLCVHIGMMQCSPTAHTHAHPHTSHTCAHLHSEHMHVSTVHTCMHLHSTHTRTNTVHMHPHGAHTHTCPQSAHVCVPTQHTYMCTRIPLTRSAVVPRPGPAPIPVPTPPRALSGWVCAEAMCSHLMAGILGVLRAAALSGLHFSEAPPSPGDEGAGTLSSTIGTLPGWALGSGPSRTTTYNHCFGHLRRWECRFASPNHAALPSCPGSGGDLCGLSWPCQPGRAGAREVGPHTCPSALGLGSPRAWITGGCNRSRLPAPSTPAGPGDTAPAVSSPLGLWNWPTLLTLSLLSGWLCPHLQLP